MFRIFTNKRSNGIIALLALTLLYSCTPNNVRIDKTLKEFFDNHHVEGAFGLFDNGQGQFTIYNLERFKDSAYAPASTFTIISALVGIQTGVISSEKMAISADSAKPISESSKDVTMEEAFKVSSGPYFQTINRLIGKDTLQHWLDTLGYGSRYGKANIGDIDSFWLDNSVKVTADEQLGLVKKLYFKQLPFQSRAQEIVKKLMLKESNANYSLSYETGTGFGKNGNAIGWAIGWIEENQHPYFFALNIEGTRNIDMASTPVTVLKEILKKQGFFEGKK